MRNTLFSSEQPDDRLTHRVLLAFLELSRGFPDIFLPPNPITFDFTYFLFLPAERIMALIHFPLDLGLISNRSGLLVMLLRSSAPLSPVVWCANLLPYFHSKFTSVHLLGFLCTFGSPPFASPCRKPPHFVQSLGLKNYINNWDDGPGFK